jgi:geranylgeranyl diphosphate synthase, type II
VNGELLTQLGERRRRFEAALRETFDRLTAGAPQRLVDAMGYSLFSGGKRLRPMLAILASEAAGGTETQAHPAACAVEMIHTYSLIHDDLPAMDDDDLRRGRPTCHIQFDEATAILAGDALLTMAFACFRGCPAKTAAVSLDELATSAGAIGMVGGQMLDMQMTGEAASGTLDSLNDLHRKKTGALFRASLRLGVFAAQAETGIVPETLAAIDSYADAFGLAFQITDDLLDVAGTAEKTGKRVGKDAAKGKLTYPGLLGIDASRNAAAELGREAVAAAKSFGVRGEYLASLADYVIHRDQ